MGRPEKLTKEQQAEAVAKVSAGQKRSEVCKEYGVSEITLARYVRMAQMVDQMNREFAPGQKAEPQMAAQEVAAEMAPPEAA